MAGRASFDDGLVPLDFTTETEPKTVAWPFPGGRPWIDLTLVLVILLAYWAIACVFAAQGFIRTPFSDTHDWTARLFDMERSHDVLSYLWQPHGNQRIIWSRLFIWWDVDIARGRGPSAFLASSMFIQACVALGAAKLVVLSLEPSVWRPCLAVLVGLVLMNAVFIEDADLPNFAVYIQAAGFAAMAIMAFALRGPGWRSIMLPLALGLGVLAMFGNAAGLAVWPVLLIGAVRTQANRPTILAVVMVGAAVILAASVGLGAPAGSGAAASQGVAHLVKMASYFCGYLGLPWTSGLRPVLRVIGAGLALLYLWAIWRGPERDGGGVLRRAGLDLMTFALITGALAAIGRVDELPEPIVPVRYATFAMLGQAGLLLALAPRLMRWAARWRWTASIGFALVLALVVLNQAAGIRAAAKTSQLVHTASDAFDRGDRSPETLRLVHSNPATAAAVRTELRRRGLPY